MAAHSDADQTERRGEMDDSERMPLPVDRRHDSRRRLIRFIPDVSAGTLLQSLSLMIGFGVAYGQYQSDRTQMRADIEAVRAMAIGNQTIVTNSLTEQKSDLKSMKVDVQDISVNLAKIQTRLEVQQQGKK